MGVRDDKEAGRYGKEGVRDDKEGDARATLETGEQQGGCFAAFGFQRR